MDPMFRLYNYPLVATTLQDKLADLKDPTKNNSDPIYDGGVRLSVPRKVSLFKGCLGVVRLRRVPKITADMGGRGKVAQIDGVVFTFVPGNSDEAVVKALHYGDLVDAYFHNSEILEIPGAKIFAVKDDPQNWDTFNVNGNPKMPKWYTIAATQFVVTKPREKAVTYP